MECMSVYFIYFPLFSEIHEYAVDSNSHRRKSHVQETRERSDKSRKSHIYATRAVPVGIRLREHIYSS